MRKFLSLLLALLMTLAAPAAFAEATETLSADQDLTFSLQSVPTIDPQQFNAAPSYVVMKGIGEGLIRTHEGQVAPGVAESWEVAEDNLKMTFHLREGACWTDGTPLTANDFVYAFRRLADPAKPRDYSWVLYEIKNAAGVMDGSLTLDQLGVSAPDEKTFVIEFATPAPYYLGFLDMPCFYPVKQELVEKFGDQYAMSADSMLTNGPFTVADYQVDQSIKLVPNENYWNREAVKLNSVTILIMEAEAAFSMLETGELDLADIPVAIAPSYLADPASIPGATVTSYANGAVDWFCINIASTENPILANQDFRLALNYALDREEYVAIATNGLYAPATRFVLPMVAGADGGYYTEQYPIDVYKSTAEADKAAEHLKKAMDAMGITDPAAITIKLKVSDTAANKLIGENCQDQWQRTLGIKVEIETVTYKAMLADRVAGAFDLVYAGWMPDYNDPYTYLSYFTSTNPQNGGKFSDARYDELVNTANTFADEKTRLAMYAEAERILMEQAGIVPLQVRQVPYGINEKLKGLVRFYLGSDLDFAYAYFVE